MDDISNPLLGRPEMRTAGQPLVTHAGQSPQLGAAQQIAWMILSPVEFVFRETSDGRGARGINGLDQFYRLRQNSIATKLWSSLDGQTWLDPYVRGLQNDDPVDNLPLALSYQSRPEPLISFYDSPGFDSPPQNTMGVNPRAIKVFLLQSFQVWCEVSPRFSRGVFQASPVKYWNSMICAQRDDADSPQWRASSGALISGRAVVNRPLCD